MVGLDKRVRPTLVLVAGSGAVEATGGAGSRGSQGMVTEWAWSRITWTRLGWCYSSRVAEGSR